MANMEDEVSFGSDEHKPASNGAAAAGSVSVTVSEDNSVLSLLSPLLIGHVFGWKLFLFLAVFCTCVAIQCQNISAWWYFTLFILVGLFSDTFSAVLAYVADIAERHEWTTACGLVAKWATAKLRPLVNGVFRRGSVVLSTIKEFAIPFPADVFRLRSGFRRLRSGVSDLEQGVKAEFTIVKADVQAVDNKLTQLDANVQAMQATLTRIINHLETPSVPPVAND